jgi:hypothetical protein
MFDREAIKGIEVHPGAANQDSNAWRRRLACIQEFLPRHVQSLLEKFEVCVLEPGPIDRGESLA